MSGKALNKLTLRSFRILILLLLISCSTNDRGNSGEKKERISAVDISTFPEAKSLGTVYRNADDNPEDLLTTLKNNGVNTIRLRLWKQPGTAHSSFKEVSRFGKHVKEKGFRLWLCVHYSDTWADPGHQVTPEQWQHIEFNALLDSVYTYTAKIVREMQPDYLQIGNEINNGMLFPYGKLSTNKEQFLKILQKGSLAIRENSSKTRIILHYAGYLNSGSFFNKVLNVDYDIIGISYYPKWHGKDIDIVETTLKNLSNNFSKPVIIAETAYPFTLQWNDRTRNLLGSENQLIPGYPATPNGQYNFMNRIREMVIENSQISGFCYWEAGWVAFKGPEATDGSPWENQAIWDFDNRVLPVIKTFQLY